MNAPIVLIRMCMKMMTVEQRAAQEDQQREEREQAAPQQIVASPGRRAEWMYSLSS